MRRRSDPIEPLPEPRAIDPRSGFNVPHSELVKEYRGSWVARRFADRPHPLDMPFRLPVERTVLPHAQPEIPERAMAVAIMWETGGLPILAENGAAILTEGEVVTL